MREECEENEYGRQVQGNPGGRSAQRFDFPMGIENRTAILQPKTISPPGGCRASRIFPVFRFRDLAGGGLSSPCAPKEG
jgi:hypothetical protein